MVWDATGRRALFDVDGKSSATVNAGPVASDGDGHLFFGGAEGVTFSGFAVKPLSDAEIKSAGFGENFAGNPTAGTWLPLIPVAKDEMRPLVCWYDGSKLAATQTFSNGIVQTPASRWACDIKEQRVAGEPEARDLTVTFKLAEGVAKSAGVAVAFDFADWSTRNYVLVPAVVYDGNRFHTIGHGYNPAYPQWMFFNPKLPLTISDDPRLSIEPDTASKIELLTGNAATPAMCFYSPSEKRGFILLCEQKSRFGNNSLFIEENTARDRATFVVSAPGVRERAAGFGGFRASGDRAADWQAGDELTLKLRTYSFPADGIPALLDKFMSVRQALTGPNHPRELVPMSAMSDAIVPRFKQRWMTAPVGSYYACENSRDFQLGWVSGFMQTPMLAIDDPLERQHICEQLDFVTENLQGKSGFFYGGITADGKLRADRTFDSRTLALTRKNCDTLLMFMKFFAILKAQGHGDLIKPAWEQSAKRLAQAFVNAWHQSHEFGQYLDPATGEVAVYNSTGGAIAPGGLALAAKYFNDPEFLRVAKASADFYYSRDVAGRGLTSGHVGDTAQDLDSESAGGFLESLMALYWATDDSAWLAKARTEAALLATWTLSYDCEFPPQSQIAKLGGHMAGAVFANTQNKHAAPGICTSSGDYLFKLYRATGDARYAGLIRDIQHAQVEATDMPGHPTCGTGTGASMERIQPTDAEGKGEIGNFIHTQNAWTELDGLMMVTELPGIYLQTDADRFFVFDSVQAKVVKRDAAGVTFTATNPTKYPARIAVFAESAAQAQQPLGYTAFLRWPHVELAPGQSGVWHVDAAGAIASAPQK